MKYEILATSFIFLLLCIPTVLGEDLQPPSYEKPPVKTCVADSDCGEMFTYINCNSKVVVPHCKDEQCYTMSHPVKSVLDSALSKAQQISDNYLKQEYGEDYFNEHFLFVKVDVTELEEPVDVNISEIKVEGTGCSPIHVNVHYNISWTSDGEHLSLPFEVTWLVINDELLTEHSYYGDLVSPPKMEKIDEIVSRNKAKEIAKQNGVEASTSDFNLGYEFPDGEHYTPVWRVRRDLDPSETLCMDYKVGVVIDASSGNVIREFTDNPCMAKAGGYGGIVAPDLTQYFLILFVVVIVVVLIIYFVKKKG